MSETETGRINFHIADKAFFYHATAMVVRYNYGLRVTTNDPDEDGGKILFIQSPDGERTMELHLCFESSFEGNPIMPIDVIKNTLSDKVAVFYVTDGRLAIFDVAACLQKKLNRFMTIGKIDGVKDFQYLDMTRSCGYRLSKTNPYRHITADMGDHETIVASEFLLDLVGDKEGLKPII